MPNNFKTVSCLGYDLFADSLDTLPMNGKLEVDTINQYSFCMAEKDPAFKTALMQSDILLPDGVGITWASRFLNGIAVKKIAGADLHQNLLQRMDCIGGSCFYLGASKETLDLIHTKLRREYPNIRVGSYSPPYKDSFSREDSELMIKQVNLFKPNVLFIGMTAPKQEKWSHQHKNELNANIICSIGAVFDFYAGKIERPGKIWIDMGLEWLGRFLKEPKRMWKRYFYYGAVFIYFIGKKKLSVDN